MIKATSKRSEISRRQFQKFVFVDGQSEKQRSLQKEVRDDLSAKSDRLLCDTQVNERVAIAQIKTDISTRNLHQLGLKPGASIEVIIVVIINFLTIDWFLSHKGLARI